MSFNIVIPIAGKAQRFVDAGFTTPKPLIMVRDMHMIDWALKSVEHQDAHLIFIVLKDHVTNFSIDTILQDKFGSKVTVIVLDEVTRGTLSTCLRARSDIDNDTPLVIYTPDVYFEPEFDPNTVSDELDGLILTFKANSPAHSYVSTVYSGEHLLAVKTAEKEVISEEAAVGVYYFRRGSDFVRYADLMEDRNVTTNGEFYICPSYNFAIKEGLKIGTQLVDKMHVLGTPEDLEFFTKRTLKRFGDKPVALCCDHSGFELKELTKAALAREGIAFIDFGTYVDTDCDHYDFLSQAVRHIKDDVCDFGMAFCRTGQGFNIAANKVPGIRSALVFDDHTASHAIRHNCANFFALSSKYTEDVGEVIGALCRASFDGGRHMTRIQRVENDKQIFSI